MEVLRSKYCDTNGAILLTDLEALAARTAMVALHASTLRDVFTLLDSQHTGVVGTDELVQMLGSLGHAAALPEIEEVCAIGDVDCDGGLDFEELCMMARTGNSPLTKRCVVATHRTHWT
jgi:hypothetical protein